jgi:formiminoglutamase
MKHLKIYNKSDLLSVTKLRRFETKLGEQLQVAENPADIEDSLQKSSAKFVVVGIPEDIGVKANHGTGGTDSMWLAFLHAFLNIQSNDFLDGKEILLLGHLEFFEVEKTIEANAHQYEEKVEAFRHAVNAIDEEVEQLIHIITQNKKLPIVIGGGQNNAYPCICGAAKGWNKSGALPLAKINAINLDAHADFGATEGRHNANGFSYAEEDGYLEKYCMVGLHENYITQNVWMDIVNNPFVDCITFEDIFIHEKRSFIQAVAHATSFTEDNLCGIELDMDAIENSLSSDITPSGISTNQARQFINFVALDSRPAYLHISEGAVILSNQEKQPSNGKLVSYLVSDFVKAILSQLR